jgi:hypothetical protein
MYVGRAAAALVVLSQAQFFIFPFFMAGTSLFDFLLSTMSVNWNPNGYTASGVPSSDRSTNAHPPSNDQHQPPGGYNAPPVFQQPQPNPPQPPQQAYYYPPQQQPQQQPQQHPVPSSFQANHGNDHFQPQGPNPPPPALNVVNPQQQQRTAIRRRRSRNRTSSSRRQSHLRFKPIKVTNPSTNKDRTLILLRRIML